MLDMSRVSLIVDARERNVLRHEEEFKAINYEQKQITTGDYVVVDKLNKSVLAVIERKSLDDFAASIKDGRSGNKNKLVELRNETGCKIVFIIEMAGMKKSLQAHPEPDDRFSGIPYRYIESSIFHLMVRDDITVIWTENTLDTAKTLVRFVLSMESLIAKGWMQQTKPQVEQDDLTAGDDNLADKLTVDINALLTAKHEKSPMDVLRELWSCFRGIATETADEFISKYTLRQLLRGEIPEVEIKNLKTALGKKISKKVVDSLTNITIADEAKILSTIPGISKVTATNICKQHRLGRLLSFDIAAIGMIKIGGDGKSERKLGSKMAEKIKNYLEMGGPSAAKQEVDKQEIPVEVDKQKNNKENTPIEISMDELDELLNCI